MRQLLGWTAVAACAAVLCWAGCKPAGGGYSARGQTLAQARAGFKTKLTTLFRANEPVDRPGGGFALVHYNSMAGSMAAYVTTEPRDGKKHPAIIWITGGDCNTIGDVWSPMPATNDQSAAAYRQAGIAMMFPSLRGGNTNPGVQEKFLGEVDDIQSAADYLGALPWVDKDRIYLGGHSTGGTLVLLTAEMTDRFRAVFAFGPVDVITSYGNLIDLPFDRGNAEEVALRSPLYWLGSIASPTFVIEGEGSGNVVCVRAMQKASTSSAAHFYGVGGMSHFSVLAPVNRLLAGKIVQDTGATCTIEVTQEELNRAVGR